MVAENQATLCVSIWNNLEDTVLQLGILISKIQCYNWKKATG